MKERDQLFTCLSDSLKSTHEHGKLLAAIIFAGILLPWILLIVLTSTHGSFTNIVDFQPLDLASVVLLGTGALVLILLVAGLAIQHRLRSARCRPLLVATYAIASLSIIITLAASAYVGLPQLIRDGDAPPQLLLTEGQSGMPGIAMVFWTGEKTTNAVELDTVGGTSQRLLEKDASHHHWVPLTGLEPGKLYKYSVNGKITGEFRAPPDADEPLHFAASGDAHFGNSLSNDAVTRKILDYLKDPDNDFSMFFVLGDSAHLGFSDALWKEAFRTISTCSSSIPTYYVIGNHDTLFGGLNLYQDYLCRPLPNDEKGRCLWTRIDRGNVHFIILDLEWDLRLYTPEQREWLVTQLESIPRDDWCIVMSHTFYYCSGSYMNGWEWYDNRGTIEKLSPLFEQYDVDLVLSGHKHQTEFLQKNGVSYVIVGAFGGPLDPPGDHISPASVWYRADAYGFVDVTIDGNGATVLFRDPDGRELFKTIIGD